MPGHIRKECTALESVVSLRQRYFAKIAWLRILVCILAGSLFVSCRGKPNTMQNHYPNDLKVEGSSGGLLPGKENYALEIRSNGNGRFTRYLPDDMGPPLEQATFKVGDTQLEALWTAIQQYDFFSLEPRYAGSNIDDGAFASLTITAGGRTHQVELENICVPRFEDLLKAINRITPSGMDLRYEGHAPNE